MIYYVMNADNALKATMQLQERKLEHSYFCEDMFSHFDDMNVPQAAKREVIKDFISVADGIIVYGDISDNMAYVLDFADEIKMEVEYIEDDERY